MSLFRPIEDTLPVLTWLKLLANKECLYSEPLRTHYQCWHGLKYWQRKNSVFRSRSGGPTFSGARYGHEGVTYVSREVDCQADTECEQDAAGRVDGGAPQLQDSAYIHLHRGTNTEGFHQDTEI